MSEIAIPDRTLTTLRTTSLRRAVVLLFLASGFCGLVYQVAWVRLLTPVFGVTAYAISTVIAAFMAGLALGSYVAGRQIDRRRDPLRAGRDQGRRRGVGDHVGHGDRLVVV